VVDGFEISEELEAMNKVADINPIIIKFKEDEDKDKDKDKDEEFIVKIEK